MRRPHRLAFRVHPGIPRGRRLAAPRQTPGAVAPVVAAEPWVALLPLLDPTVMGWKARAFYLGAHAPQLFDSAGNAGTTAWVDGRVVGAWVQDPGGVVELRLLDDDVSPQAREALAAEARRLSAWLDGQRVFTVYPSLAMQPCAGR
ncbi:crosslink repair DNA glycosylase YcaQ family protein [Streptomyces sp. NPDC002896]|uniref:DNA glycosylase AlkZ-like family protein n=1 Tax=Streptomyces sp. NPDC002896 TaxID=3154438 RepID=UPI00332BFFBD